MTPNTNFGTLVMNNTFLILTIVLIVISVAMILIILVQRPQGGGLASAFGGAGGGSTDTVFGGRVGDALTVMTVIAFVLFLSIAVALNLVESKTIATGDVQSVVAPNAIPGQPTSTPDHPTAPNRPTAPDHPTGSN